MNDLTFFRPATPLSLALVLAHGGARADGGLDTTTFFTAVATLDLATPHDVAVLGDENAIGSLVATRAGACFVTQRHRHHVPSSTIALVTEEPVESFRRIALLLQPSSVIPTSSVEGNGIDPSAIVHRDARLEPNVTVDPGVIVGPRVEIGAGTIISANSTIGAGVRIGRNCAIDAQVFIAHAFIGDRVVIHAGARIGHAAPRLDAAGAPAGPHLGRVIIQNDVEIGANATIERGRMTDTIIGDGSRIWPLVRIAGDTMVDRLMIVR